MPIPLTSQAIWGNRKLQVPRRRERSARVDGDSGAILSSRAIYGEDLTS